MEVPGDYVPRYNAAPTQPLPIIIEEKGVRRMVMMRWGLIPSWARDASMGAQLINARFETLAEKPSFKDALTTRRCLIPSDGFFEWVSEGKRKRPFRITTEPNRIFAIAGLWDRWIDPDHKEILSFTIITVPAGAQIKHIHDRMPLILPEEIEDKWLDPSIDWEEMSLRLRNKAEENFIITPVNSRVNSAQPDEPSLLDPPATVDDETLF